MVSAEKWLFACVTSFMGNRASAVSKIPLFSGLYLILVNNYKRRTLPNDSLNPAHPIIVAQVKLQPKDQMWLFYPSS